MKKKTNVRTLIRQIVREEVAMAIGEVVNELKQPTLSSKQVSQSKPKKKVVEKKNYTTNSVLNDVINETAQSEEWKTMGGGTYDSGKMNEVLSSQYGDLMTDNSGEVNPDAMVASMGINPDKAPDAVKNMFKKDYRSILKKSIQKSDAKRGI